MMPPQIFQFKGIYTPIVTPYHADGGINWDALSDVTEYLIERGVHGLVTGGSTGENYTQTVDERLRSGESPNKQKIVIWIILYLYTLQVLAIETFA
jgi:4-hydroxy-tetrahydrodipicolinate synthase